MVMKHFREACFLKQIPKKLIPFKIISVQQLNNHPVYNIFTVLPNCEEGMSDCSFGLPSMPPQAYREENAPLVLSSTLSFFDNNYYIVIL